MTMSLLLERFDDLLATPEDVEQLNYTILQLATQGKLAEQDSNDKPVNKALQEIHHQEDNEKLYDLPKSWKWIYLHQCVEILDGQRVPVSSEERIKRNSGKKQSELYPYYGATSQTGWIDDYLFDEELVLLGEDGVPFLEQLKNKAYIISGKSWVNNHAHVIKALSDIAINSYIKHYLNIFDYDGYVSGTTRWKLNQAKMKQIPIPLPPLAEQERIVARVEELFAQTRALAKELDHSESELDGLNKSALSHLLASKTPDEFNQHWHFVAEHFGLLFQAPEHVAPLRQSVLELAVRGKLTRREAGDESAKELFKRISDEKEKLGKPASLRKVSEEEKPFDLPQGWEWTRWDNVSLQIGDVDHKMPDEIPDGIPYISPRDFTGKEDISFATAKKISRKDYEDLAEKIKPERGDIIFPRYGTIGVNRFVSVDFEFLASYSCCIIKHMKELMNPRYVFFYSISPFLRQETQKYVNKTTQPNVGIKSIQQFLFPLPPLAEQERIVKRVEQLLSLCDALEARLQSAEEERGRLVAAVMSTVGG